MKGNIFEVEDINLFFMIYDLDIINNYYYIVFSNGKLTKRSGGK